MLMRNYFLMISEQVQDYLKRWPGWWAPWCCHSNVPSLWTMQTKYRSLLALWFVNYSVEFSCSSLQSQTSSQQAQKPTSDIFERDLRVLPFLVQDLFHRAKLRAQPNFKAIKKDSSIWIPSGTVVGIAFASNFTISRSTQTYFVKYQWSCSLSGF